MANDMMYLWHQHAFVITSVPQMCNDGWVRVNIELQDETKKTQEIFLADYHLHPEGKNSLTHWRTFRWSKETEACLRELVECQALTEYLEIINRTHEETTPVVVWSDDTQEVAIKTASPLRCHAEWSQLGKTRSLVQRVADPRRNATANMIAKRNARLAAEEEERKVKETAEKTDISSPA